MALVGFYLLPSIPEAEATYTIPLVDHSQTRLAVSEWAAVTFRPAPLITRPAVVRRETSTSRYMSFRPSGHYTAARDSFSTNEPEMRAALRRAGFTKANVEVALAIAKAESGLRSDATSKSGTMIGPFQINKKAHPYIPEAEARDIEKSAKWAYKLSGGKNFRPWTVYTKGTYRKYLKPVPEETE